MSDTLFDDTLDKIKNVQSFIGLKRLYNTWIEDGTIEKRKDFLLIGYSSLITHPVIILPDGIAGLKSAEECQVILLKYAKNHVDRMLASEDENTKLAASLLVMPPNKAILFGCKTFYELYKLIKIDTDGLSDEEIHGLNGDVYAKAWINIAKTGLSEKDNLDTIASQMGGSAFIIRKMHLSKEMQDLFDDNHVEDYSDKFFGRNESEGCFSIIAILIISTAFCLFI